MFGSHSDNLLGNVSDIVGTSTEICIENFTWKKANGFLHLVEEIFCTFDMAHISPFLNVLLIIVARLLESCMQNLRSDSDGKYPCKQSNDHDNDCLINVDMSNSADRDEHPKEIHIVDHMEVCGIITLGSFSFTLMSFHCGTLVTKLRMPSYWTNQGMILYGKKLVPLFLII